jgi:hypothetical protein
MDSFLVQKPNYGAAFAYCPVRWGTDFVPNSIILVFEYGTVFPWRVFFEARATPKKPTVIKTRYIVWPQVDGILPHSATRQNTLNDSEMTLEP